MEGLVQGPGKLGFATYSTVELGASLLAVCFGLLLGLGAAAGQLTLHFCGSLVDIG